MNFVSLVLTAFGLSMDAFAVALTNGMAVNTVKVRYALKTGIFFGIFQGLMPVIGWAAGIKLSSRISNISPWLALIILSFIGLKMIREALKPHKEHDKKGSPRDTKSLLILALATSIDALAVGISFAFLNVSITLSSALIAIITFGVCTGGVHLGKKVGSFFGSKAEILGGCILILIGVKMVLNHLGIINF